MPGRNVTCAREPVSDIIGHCFVVGDNIRDISCVPPCRRAGAARVAPLQKVPDILTKKNVEVVFYRTTSTFFSWEEFRPWRGLGRSYARQVARPGQANASRTWSAMKNDENFNMSIRHVEGIRCPGQQGGWLRCRAGGRRLRNLAFVTLVAPMSRNPSFLSFVHVKEAFDCLVFVTTSMSCVRGALGIEASDAGQECDAGKHKWHLCFRSALELETSPRGVPRSILG